jgi:multicomponent Na+:H+ antiporter subunit F
MHELVFQIATLWMALLVLPCIWRILFARSTAGRILALDTVILLLVGILVLWSDAERVPFFLDAALLLALLGFIGSLAAARFYARGRIF